MEIYFATTNTGKVQSLQRDLQPFGITVIPKPIELVEPRSSDVREIAAAKIRQAWKQVQKPVIAMDAGFYMDALNGFPRAYVNFALETIGTEGILKLTEGKPRGCEFRECLAYMDGSLNEPHDFITRVRGTLAHEQRGTFQEHLWSDLSRIFIPEKQEQTLAEMAYEDYVHWNAAIKAVDSTEKQLYEWLRAKAGQWP